MALREFPEAGVELFQDWLRMLPVASDGSSFDPVRSMRAALVGDLGRVRWEADVSSAALVDPFLDFCASWDTDDDALALIGAVGADLDPPVLGTWVESRPDGSDLGWAIDGRWTVAELGRLVPLPGDLRDDLVVRRLARSLATGAPTTRLLLELPVGDQTTQVSTASDVLARLDAPLPGDGALGVFLNLAAGDVLLSLWTLDDGVAATGLTTRSPSTELLVAMAHELGQVEALDVVAEFGALLLVDEPDVLELRVRATGDEYELTYSVPETAPELDDD